MAESDHILSTKERIIQTTLDIIAAEGFHKVTVRKIATQAHVNIAAVNYHFGSKDAVIDRALKYVTSRMINVFSILKNTDQSPDIRLASFIRSYADTVYAYPDIVRYMINQKIHDTNGPVEYTRFLENQGINLITQTLVQLNPDADPQLLLMKTLHILSSISFPVLMSGHIREIAGLDLFEPETRSCFVKLLIDSIL